MTVAWLNLAGLILDLAGFALLLREWWVAVFNEDRQLDLAASRERQQQFRAFAANAASSASEPHRRHMETAARMQDEQAIRHARDAHRGTLRTRRWLFGLAAALIVIGSLLQIAANIPMGILAPQ